MTHRLSEIDEQARTGICSVCGPTKIKMRNSKRVSLKGKYKCKAVYQKAYDKLISPYAIHKKDYCQQCGFNPVHPSQLDVDHIDGDRWNNDPSNLQTLCANCHRLKTHLNGDANSGIW